MATPGRTASCASVTLPAIEDVPCCAKSGADSTSAINTRSETTRILPICRPPCVETIKPCGTPEIRVRETISGGHQTPPAQGFAQRLCPVLTETRDKLKGLHSRV